MKVVHINTYDSGGAGIAAIRLHCSLLKYGIESSFLSLFSSETVFPMKYQHQYSNWERGVEYARIKWRVDSNAESIEKINEQCQKRNLEVATLPDTNFDITAQRIYKEADIINLHWTSGYLNHSSFWKKNTKPVVWTLHDINPFSGIYHYPEDEARNRKVLGELDLSVKKKKKEFYQQSEIDVVCLSKWLMDISVSSEMFQTFSHHYIPNSVDTTIFRIQQKEECKERLGLPRDKKICLFVGQDVANYRKGYDLLLKALLQLQGLDAIQAVAVGKVPQEKDKNIIYLGGIHNESKMAEVYAAADVFVMPSREDNLPNVMLESLACGTPVICFPVGGMIDVIEDGINGYFCPEMTGESLGQTILKWLNNSSDFVRQHIRDRAVALFSEEIQAKGYIDLYQKTLNRVCVTR